MLLEYLFMLTNYGNSMEQISSEAHSRSASQEGPLFLDPKFHYRHWSLS